MAYDVLLVDCAIESFRDMFISKKEYRQTVRLSTKERMREKGILGAAFSHESRNVFEENLRNHLTSNDLIKFKAKERVARMPITSYILDDDGSTVVVYASYGGRRHQVTAEGWVGDRGYFLKARQASESTRLQIETKREHYKSRTRSLNVFLVILGLFLGVLPGLLLAGFLIFMEPNLNRKNIDRVLIPVLEKTFGRVQ